MKEIIKRLLPSSVLTRYHRTFAIFFDWLYGHPSRKLIIIGVTGTNGKSSTVTIIADLLECLGYSTGVASTINFKVGKKEWLNDKKMTMLGRGALQRLLRDMVRAGCRFAVIETSSEGIKQFRHLGIDYDAMVFTNLTPEHIESHGGFNRYKAAKLSVFSYLARLPRKMVHAMKVPRFIVVNGDDEHGKDFLNFPVNKKITFGTESKEDYSGTTMLRIADIALKSSSSTFSVNGISFAIPYIGSCNVYNVAAALGVAVGLGFSLEQCVPCTQHFRQLPGRFEMINEGQPFKVLVDYAPEPASLKVLYETLSLIQHRHLIHILGSAGGGRDRARRTVLGEMAGKHADTVIVTNEDPYDEDPETIIQAVADGARRVGKRNGKDLFTVSDRKEAIAEAFRFAHPGDLVVITGKGSEQAIVGLHGKKNPWDDRVIVRELLKKFCG